MGKVYISVTDIDFSDSLLRIQASYGPDFAFDYTDAQLVFDFLCKIQVSLSELMYGHRER